MKINNFCLSILLLCFGTYTNSLAQCEEFEKVNKRLVLEKQDINDKLADALAAQDKWYNEYIKEHNLRLETEKKYYAVLNKKQQLEKDIESLRSQVESTNYRIEQLERERERLIAEGKKNSELYDTKIIELNNEKSKRRRAEDDYKLLDSDYSTQGEAIISYERKIETLKRRAENRISLLNKVVYFNGETKELDSEILFIPYRAFDANISKLDEQHKELLDDFGDMMRKYDYKRLKIIVIGESVGVDEELRQGYETARCSEIKSYLMREFNIQDSRFKTKGLGSRSKRTGVQIILEY